MAAATPIIIETPSAEITVLQSRIDPHVIRAGAFQIATQAVYEEAADFLRDCKTLQKEITETMEPAITKAHAAHKAMTALRSKFMEPVTEAEKVVKGKMGAFLVAEEQKQIAARRIQEEEARRVEEDRRLREAAEYEARGMPEAAEEVISAPIVLPAVKEEPKPMASGISSAKRYSAKVVDLEALIRAAADGKIPAGIVVADQQVLNQMARALKTAFRIPGVELVEETSISAKAR